MRRPARPVRRCDMTATCATCVYSRVHVDTGATGRPITVRRCHRNAPKPHPHSGARPNWPAVMDDDWCGEWRS